MPFYAFLNATAREKKKQNKQINDWKYKRKGDILVVKDGK